MKKIRILFDKYQNLNIVLKASIWFVAVTVIDRAVSILTQPFINRLLTTEEVGVYGIYSSWHSIFSIIATFNLFCGVLEVNITKNKDDRHTVTGSIGILCLFVSLLFFCGTLIFISPLSRLISLKPSYIVLMFITIIGDSLIQFWAVPKRFEYSYKIYSFVTVGVFALKSVLSVFLTFFCEEDRILGRLIGLGLPSLICGIALFISVLLKTNFKRITSYWKVALKFNLPLIPHYLSTVLLSSSDRVMIEKFATLSDAGLYSIAYSFSSLCLIVFSAINSAYNPYCMSAIKEEKYERLSKATKGMMLFSIMFSLLIIYFAPEGLLILGGKEYLEVLPIVPILVVGIFFSSFYFVFSNVEFVYEKTKFVFPITLLGTLLNIGLNYWLIPIIGYGVAAYTTFIGYLFISIAHYFASRLILKKDIFDIKVIVFYLLAFLGFATFGLVLYKIHFLFRYAFIILILCLCVYYGIKNKKYLTGSK